MSAEAMTIDNAAEDSQRGKYLTFPLLEALYGIEIRHVLEVVIRNPKTKITQIPHMPPFAKGVINLRGKVVPIIDLHLRFGLPESAYDERTCYVVVNISGVITGLVVDTVAGVVGIPEGNIDEPPHLESSIQSRFIAGMGKTPEQVYILLDVNKLFGKEELDLLRRSTEP
jgi:purine-binding chemotaxis protein CheW